MRDGPGAERSQLLEAEARLDVVASVGVGQHCENLCAIPIVVPGIFQVM